MKTFLYIALPILAVLGLMFGLSLSWTIYYGVTEHYLTFPRIWVIAAMMLAGLGACVFGLKCIRRDLRGRFVSV